MYDEPVLPAEEILAPKYKPKVAPEYFHNPTIAKQVNNYREQTDS